MTLTDAERVLLAEARRAVLATIARDGRPRLVPIAYAVAPWPGQSEKPILYSALDEKPKSVDDPKKLARVRDITARNDVTVLVDRWDEDWTLLAWLRLDGTATLLEPTAGGTETGRHRDAVRLLRDRYPQYADQRLEDRPVIRIEIARAVSWGLEREVSA